MDFKAIQVAGSPSISGKLDEETFSDLCQALARQTGMLRITGTHTSGEIFFSQGRIVHAETDSCHGKEALLDLASTTSGNFLFFRGLASNGHTIRESTDSLLMEAAMYGDYMNGLRRLLIVPSTFLECPMPSGAVNPDEKVLVDCLQKPRSLIDLLASLKSHGIERVAAAELILQLAERNVVAPSKNLSRLVVHGSAKPRVSHKLYDVVEKSPAARSGWKLVMGAALLLSLFAGAAVAWSSLRSSKTAQELKDIVLQPPTEKRQAEVEMEQEIRSTIENARRFVYGSRSGRTDLALTPLDLDRLARSGFGPDDILREIEERGFTGFPDPFEERRIEQNVTTQVADSLQEKRRQLNESSLQTFVKKHPLGGPNPGIQLEVPPTHLYATQVAKLAGGIRLIESARAEFQAQGLDTSVLDLKTILLRQRLMELTEVN